MLGYKYGLGKDYIVCNIWDWGSWWVGIYLIYALELSLFCCFLLWLCLLILVVNAAGLVWHLVLATKRHLMLNVNDQRRIFIIVPESIIVRFLTYHPQRAIDICPKIEELTPEYTCTYLKHCNTAGQNWHKIDCEKLSILN